MVTYFKRILLILTSILLTYCQYAIAQSQNLEVEIDTLEESTIDSLLITTDDGQAVEVVGRSVNLKIPASLMQIYPEHIKRDPDVSIAPSLNRVTGVYMHTGALNTNRITIRGIGNRSPFSTTKIRAYLDDIPLTGGDGETTIEDIDLTLVDKISVWKGPTASNYGAGLGGMIYLQTNNEKSASNSEIQHAVTTGSFGLLRNVSTASIGNADGSLRVKGNFNFTISDGFRDNNEYDRKGASILVTYNPNSKNQTTIFGNWIDLKAFIPSSLNFEDYTNNPEKAAFTWASVNGFEDYTRYLFGLSHKTSLGLIGNYRFRNRSSIFLNNRSSYESRPFNILSEDSEGYGFRSSFDLMSDTRSVKDKPFLTLGIEYFNEKYDWQTFQTNSGVQGEILSDNAENRTYVNVFIQSFYAITEKATLYTGMNLNSTRYSYDDLLMTNGIDKSGEYGFNAIFSPNLGLSYQFNYKFSLFGSVSHGFSPPSLSETLTPEGVPNPNIAPEKGWNFEIGSRGNIASKFTYELTAYTMLIDDLIVARRVGEDQFIGLNAGATTHNGVELFMEYLLEVSDNFTAKPFFTYTYSDYTFTDFVDGTNDYSGNSLTGTPPHQINAGIDISLKSGFYGYLNMRHVASFPMRDDNSIYSDAFTVIHSKIGFRKQIFDWLDLDVSGGIRNIFDEQYASMILINAGSFGGNQPRYYYPGLPRNYFASLSLRVALGR